jgi:glycosyltransferase involved in cell wall biosynthesis
MRVSVIIPVYNEFPTFRQVLERVQNAPLHEGCSKEIVVVDDGSTDGTAQVFGDHERAGLIVGHHSETNCGKGTAIRTGIAIASGDIILIQDGDLEYDPSDYMSILEPIVSGEADVVYGSRFQKQFTGMEVKYRVANRVLTALANLLYDARITDEATAYKAFRASVLRDLRLECRRFEFCPEVTAKLRRLGHNIREVPIRYNPRGIAEGKKIRFADGLEALWTLLKYRFVSRKSLVRQQEASALAVHGHFYGRAQHDTPAWYAMPRANLHDNRALTPGLPQTRVDGGLSR